MADEKNIATEEEGEEEEGGGSKKKLFIIIGAAVLLLVIAGGAAVFLLGGESAEDGVVEEGEPMYHEFEPTFVVNLAPGSDSRMLQVAIEIMARTPSVIDTLVANDPMIRHHILVLLEGKKSGEIMDAKGREALQKSIHDMLAGKLKELNEPGEIKGVYFTQFVMQ